MSEKTTICDYLTGDAVRETPEELVRQIILRRLVEEYGYPKSLMAKEFPIQKGSKKIGPADVVVFRDDTDRSQDNIWIIVETKRRERTDGIDQLKTYLSPTRSAKFGLWFNGDLSVVLRVSEKRPYYRETFALPKYGQSTIDLPMKADLKPAVELKTVFEVCHNHIYANEGLLKEKVFNEVLKLIFIKIVDEKSTEPMCEFGVAADEEEALTEGKKSAFQTRITGLFDRVKNAYPDVFEANERISLKPATLGFVVAQLQNFSLVNTDLDAKGIAFQTFVYSHQRGERGEFFTPHTVVQLAVDVLVPRDYETVCDPACGSAGFLIKAMQHVWDRIDLYRHDLSDAKRQDMKFRYAHSFVRGSDINPDLSRVAKMHMILYEDGHAGVFAQNSLQPIEELSISTRNQLASDAFDIVLTNPPFGSKGKVTERRILKEYHLAHKWSRDKSSERYEEKAAIQKSMVPDILFIERVLELLKPNGRCAIVLPNGDLNNIQLQHVRQFLMGRTRLLGVVSLPIGTFKAAGANPQSSVLFLQKLKPNEAQKLTDQGYDVFMAIAEDVGFDVRLKDAPPLYMKNDDGTFVLNDDGEKIIANDLPKITERFQEFLLGIGVDFVKPEDVRRAPYGNKAKHAIVNTNQFTDRIDANFYVTKRSVSNDLEELGYEFVQMSDVASFPRAKTPPRDAYGSTGTPVLKLKNIGQDYLHFDDCDYVASEIAPQYVAPRVNDILITATGEGTIGRACIYTANDHEAIVTGENIILRPDSSKINPFYLLYFLRSDIGKDQLVRFARGSSGQTHLYAKDIRKMVVPKVSRDQQVVFEHQYLEALESQRNAEGSFSSIRSQVNGLFAGNEGS